jgi:hypothetical protein
MLQSAAETVRIREKINVTWMKMRYNQTTNETSLITLLR